MKKLEQHRIWEFKQAAEPNVLELYIYGNIKPDGYDWWKDEVIESETSAEHFRKELTKYSDVREIRLYVNSFGGSVFEAMAIRNQLKRHSATIVGYVDGFACSAASFILTACDTVKMYSNTMQMIHNALNAVFGNATELRKAADDLDQIMIGNRQAYLEKSNGKLTEEVLINMLEAETWLTASQCLEYGLADEVLESSVDLNEAEKMLEQRNQTLVQKINYNKALVALAKEIKASTATNEPEPIPEPIPEPVQSIEPGNEPDPIEPTPIQENKILKMISSLMN